MSSRASMPSTSAARSAVGMLLLSPRGDGPFTYRGPAVVCTTLCTDYHRESGRRAGPRGRRPRGPARPGGPRRSCESQERSFLMEEHLFLEKERSFLRLVCIPTRPGAAAHRRAALARSSHSPPGVSCSSNPELMTCRYVSSEMVVSQLPVTLA